MQPPTPQRLFRLPTTVTSFSAYFRLRATTKQVAEAFGYTFSNESLITLPQTDTVPSWSSEIKERVVWSLNNIELTTETARRESVVAPILLETTRQLGTQILIEYVIEVAEQLRGDLDYVLLGTSNLLVVEAKLGDPMRGATQLIAEMIALDKLRDVSGDAPHLFGAVTLGNLWQFFILERERRHLTQDEQVYVLPRDMETLLRVLIGILQTPVSNG